MGPIHWASALMAAGVRQHTAETWAPLFDRYIQPEAFSAGHEEMDDFVGQILHESARLESLEEGLWYSTPERLCAVWPSRFPTPFDALPFVHAPQALAEKVYGGRLGNTQPGDAYRFRGRGLVQITGRANYQAVQDATGVPILDSPDILATPEQALVVSKAWWDRKIPDSAVGDIKRITRLVNGGLVGLADREELTQLTKDATT
jgi:putative chitinase